MEAAAVLAAPILIFFVLRLRLMPWPDLNDPAMHTAFIVNPQDIFNRFTALLTPTARLREGARVGFLEPARISYLLFGGVPGFIVFRYVLALIAVVPAYILLRRLYGIPAAALGVVLILGSPVLVTAWGTDYPDSATVAYLLGGIACLAMPAPRHRGWWLMAAAVLFTLAVWAFASALPLVLATIAAYAVVRLSRERRHLLRDTVVSLLVAAATTLTLAVGSLLLLGQFDFIGPTIRSITFLSQPSQEVIWHSRNWHWVLYDAFLLVPPTVLAAAAAALTRRRHAAPTPVLFAVLTLAAQLLVAALLQFVGSLQILEVHYFSSLLWAATTLALAIVLIHLAQPLRSHLSARWALPLIGLAVPAAFEIAPAVPAFGWLPTGAAVAASTLAVAAAGRWTFQSGVRARAASGVIVAAVLGGLLVLTLAPEPAHAPIPNASYDQPPPYAGALGGDASAAVDLYRVTTEVPGFVGPAAFHDELLLMWWPRDQLLTLQEPIGMYHAYFNSIPSRFGALDDAGRAMVEERRPGQVLLLSLTGARFVQAVSALSAYDPVVVRSTVLRSGSIRLYLVLVDLKAFGG